jgi:hypothetical protein
MPTILRARGYRLFFYSNEGGVNRPMFHVERRRREAKFWLRPEVYLAYNDGFSARGLRELLTLIEATVSASKKHGMNSSVRAMSVRFDQDNMWAELSDGRMLGVPLAWFPRLPRATREQCEACRLSGRGVHWEALDEDVSITGLLAGYGDQTRDIPSAAK